MFGLVRCDRDGGDVADARCRSTAHVAEISLAMVGRRVARALMGPLSPFLCGFTSPHPRTPCGRSRGPGDSGLGLDSDHFNSMPRRPSAPHARTDEGRFLAVGCVIDSLHVLWHVAEVDELALALRLAGGNGGQMVDLNLEVVVLDFSDVQRRPDLVRVGEVPV